MRKNSVVAAANETKGVKARANKKDKADDKIVIAKLEADSQDEKKDVSERPKKRRKSAQTEPNASDDEIKVGQASAS